MLELKVSGNYYHKTGHKTNERKSFNEVFTIHEDLEKNALQVVQRMLIKSRLSMKYAGKFLQVHTCQIIGKKKVVKVTEILTQDELYETRDDELIEYLAQRGIFVHGSKLANITELRASVYNKAPSGEEGKSESVDPAVQSEFANQP